MKVDYRIVVAVLIGIVLFVVVVALQQQKKDRERTSTIEDALALTEPYNRSIDQQTEPEREEGPYLEILDWGWRSEHGFAVVEGEVKNLTSSRLQNVTATVRFYTEDDSFITSGEALIDFNPILPNQVSTFTVYVTHNPLMHRANLRFKELLGGSISARSAE